MNDCANCRPRLRAIAKGGIFPCPEAAAEYFPIGIVEEYFCRHHVYWLISWYELLKEGRYPPQQSGYVPQPGYSASTPQSAPFERASQVFTMLSEKLRRTGEDGQTLLSEIDAGLRMNELAPAAKKALNYISSPKLRRESYKDFKARHRKHAKASFKGRS